MIVAVDIKTGTVVGQVTGSGTPVRATVKGKSSLFLLLLNKTGYQYVSVSTVRLQKA